MNIKGKEYTEVKYRILDFRKLYPDWSIKTEISGHHESFTWVVFHAILLAPNGQEFHGWAYEERVEKDYNDVNFSAWLENCETSAIGRALANMGLAGGGERPSAEEMVKVERAQAKVLTGPEGKKKDVEDTARKVLKISKDTGNRKEAMEKLVKVEAELRRIVGHDKYFLQALDNRKIKETKDLPIVTMEEIADNLQNLVDSANAVSADLDAEERKKIIQDKLDKMSLFV